MENETIAITRTFDDIEAATRRVIADIGGMQSVLQGARVALLKPNFVAGRHEYAGATTHFAIIKAVAAEVRACGVEPVLCEIPGTEFDLEATYQMLNLEQFCQDNHISILRLDPEGNTEDWIDIQVPGARILRHFRIPRLLSHQDTRLINLPVLKTHMVSIMSLGMKNLMGILPRPERRTMHTFGIDQGIVDMNLGLKPALTIVDGCVGQDGDGPLYGDRAQLQVVVAGRNSLAVDLVCCQLVGVKPRAVPHLKLALAQMGKPDWQIVGTNLNVLRPFRLPQSKGLYRFIFRLMFLLDYPYSKIAERGKHLCTTIYSSGLVGTRPQINREQCTGCGICVEACPLPDVIDLQTLKINYQTCQRCLLCYEYCPEQAISVKGFSGAQA
ncbi:DUF362 domain-containing protein [Dictyobacter formicarum]|uniref:4Fe-4S ferredoxin-type domain-containing protein n=1 Tax=Dictyobacter formicarum TaxID=2778368 RepID=A0ABQ3VTD7_9CHLR|nr:DUF362 domain-containing protein [Dictyobacter formicarum]GHO89001.1 hypothetical protein KSZ_70070 [Dictyobacter formicarum]